MRPAFAPPTWAVIATACALLVVPPARAQTRVVLLGTGTPNPEPDRSGPAVAVVVGSSAYLVDAGPGVVRRAEAARRLGVAALSQPGLTTVFLTHLHSDHTLGLPDLVFSPWVLERTAPLRVFGPRGTAAMIRHIEEAWAEDVHIRLDGWQPQNTTGHRVTAREIDSGLVFADSNVRVYAYRVTHGSVPDAFAYRFETADRVVVISGDTHATDAIVEACRGCDVLVHEVYSDAGFARLPPAWQRYHAAFHTSARELGALATRARPGLLVLYHQLTWGGVPLDSIPAEVRRSYGGRVAFGRDLDVY